MCKQELHNEIKHKKYVNIQTGQKLDLERINELPDNALLKARIELWVDWDFKKNSELGLDIWKVTKGSGKKAWWECSKCKSSYDSRINERALKADCPYCTGKRTNSTNSLALKNEELNSQWHPVLNGELTPHDVTCGSNKKVWWLGECGHEWEAYIVNRTKGKGCPYCSNNKLLVGFNDMWTTNPELAKLLADPEDGYKYNAQSNKKVDWKCECGENIKNKQISNVSRQGLSCSVCGDGFSYNERLVSNILKSIDVLFITQKTFEWSSGCRFDFYLPNSNTLIEAHGEQHYIQTRRKGARSLEEEQANDRYKYEIAITNGIKPENYIVIDCRYSNFEYIKNNILNSKLAELFDLSDVDWSQLSIASQKSRVIEVWRSYNLGSSIKEISKNISLAECTVVDYLKRGNSLGKCDYCEIINRKRASRMLCRAVIRISKYEIKTYNSLKDASINNELSYQTISACCNGKQKTSGGFKWMYKEDYDKYIKEQNLNKLA